MDDGDIFEEPLPHDGEYSRLLSFLQRKHKPKPKGAKGLSVRPLEWLEDRIRDIWRSKHESDCIDDHCGHRHQRLPDFVYEFLLREYQTKPVADKEAFLLVDAISHHKENS